MVRLTIAIALASLACIAHSQTMYRCTVGGKVVYQAQPCTAGDEKRIQTDAAPTPEDVERAKARVGAAQQRSEQAASESAQSRNALPLPAAQQAVNAQRIRELEVIISSTTIDSERRRAAQEELRRLQRGSSGMSAEDQRRLREAEVDLTSIDPNKRRKAEETQRRILDDQEAAEARRRMEERRAPQSR